MRVAPWIIASVSFGLLARLLLNQPVPLATITTEPINDVAKELVTMGAAVHAKGTRRRVGSKTKKSVGMLANDGQVAVDSIADQIADSLQTSISKTAQVVERAID